MDVSEGTGKRILVVDDDQRICRLLARFLSREGYAVTAALNGREMREAQRNNDFDLIILDVMMPGEDGFMLARDLRGRSRVPIVFLSGKGDTIDKVVGLELGADDYITKPFEERELLARVRSILRRAADDGASATEPASRAVHFAGWRLDLLAHELTAPDGKAVPLTSYEFQVLALLVRRPNQIISRDELLGCMASRDWTPYDRSVDVLIAKLRKKIEKDPKAPVLIKTLRGSGYKLTAELKKG